MKRAIPLLMCLMFVFLQSNFVNGRENYYYEGWRKTARSGEYSLYGFFHTSEGLCPTDIIIIVYTKHQQQGFCVDEYYEDGSSVFQGLRYWYGNTDVESVKVFNRMFYFIDEKDDNKFIVCTEVTLKELWRYQLPLSSSKNESILYDVNNDYVVISIKDRIFILDSVNGEYITDYQGEFISNSYYCGYLLKQTTALVLSNPITKKILWYSDLSVDKIKCFGIAHNVVIIAAEGLIKDKLTKVVCLDVSTGKIIWAFDTEQEIIDMSVEDFGLIYETKYSETERSYNIFTVRGGFCWWGKTSINNTILHTNCNFYCLKNCLNGNFILTGVNTKTGKPENDWQVTINDASDLMKKILCYGCEVVYFDKTLNLICCFIN